LRIAILGNSGSGKSTLASWIRENTRAVSLDLDNIAWEPHQIAVPRAPDVAARDVDTFCRAHESWVIEGCYASLVSVALTHQPRLLLLNPGVDACTVHCRARPWEPHKFASKQAQDEHLSFLLKWVKEYYARNGDMSLAAHLECFDRYDGPKRIVDTTLNYAVPSSEMRSWLR
jgi:adenylate kinase family enzyme